MYISACYLYVKIFRLNFYIFGNSIVQVTGKPVYYIGCTLDPVRDQQIVEPFFCNGNRWYTHDSPS